MDVCQYLLHHAESHGKSASGGGAGITKGIVRRRRSIYGVDGYPEVIQVYLSKQLSQSWRSPGHSQGVSRPE
jgi:hypothetical protein